MGPIRKKQHKAEKSVIKAKRNLYINLDFQAFLTHLLYDINIIDSLVERKKYNQSIFTIKS